MNNQNNDKRRIALMNDAALYRERLSQAGAGAAAPVTCSRGHSWDDALDRGQNVRCMNCASQRREMDLKRMHDIAQMRGGKLLSPVYMDAAAPLTWQCAWEHVWNADGETAQRSWCDECGRTVFSQYR